MRTIFDLLDEIEQRPAMYVGYLHDGPRSEQLRNLEYLLFGYTIALRHHNLDESGMKDFPSKFAQYLFEKHDWSGSCGAVTAIRDAAKNDEEAWTMFWQLVREFRTTLESKKDSKDARRSSTKRQPVRSKC
jgi:hypothetical protein